MRNFIMLVLFVVAIIYVLNAGKGMVDNATEKMQQTTIIE